MKEQLKKSEDYVKKDSISNRKFITTEYPCRDPMGEHECMNDTIRIIAEEGKV